MLTRGRGIALVLAGAFLALGVVVGGRMSADADPPPRDTTPITVVPGGAPTPSPSPTTTTGSISPELRDDDDDDGPDDDDGLRDDDDADDGADDRE